MNKEKGKVKNTWLKKIKKEVQTSIFKLKEFFLRDDLSLPFFDRILRPWRF